jgi:hypothetical protein
MAFARACFVGLGDRYLSALLLSLKNGLVFVGFGPEEKTNQIYGCLYGQAGPESHIPGWDQQLTPVIPAGTAYLEVFQGLVSVALIFLLVLAIRNTFRIG